jgi:hypothetical protein
MSVRSLTCTGSGDGTLSFGPLGPTIPTVAQMDLVAHFPTHFSQKASPRRSWGCGLASTRTLLRETTRIPLAVCVPCL